MERPDMSGPTVMNRTIQIRRLPAQGRSEPVSQVAAPVMRKQGQVINHEVSLSLPGE
jgi:hypothetical protein